MLAVVERDVLEGVEVEVGVQLAVDHRQQVAVERRGDAGGVVVGGLEHGRVLDQVGAEQQPVLRAQQRGRASAGTPPRAGREVADRAAEEGDHARALGGGQRVEVALEVAEDAVHAQPGYPRRAARALSRSTTSETSNGT